MANRYLRQFILTQDPKQVLISGNFSLSAAAAVSATDFNSLVSSVTKTGTGLYTITLSDKYQKLRAAHINVQTTDAGVSLQNVSDDVSGAKTIVIRTVKAGAAADVTAAAKIYVTLILKDSTVR
jgi:hypothetical protein